MEQFLLPNSDAQTRRDTLESMAAKVVEGEKYDRRLSDEEVAQRRVVVLRQLDKLGDIAEAKKAAMDEFKAEASAESKLLEAARMEAKTGIATEKGQLYYIADYDLRKMGMYNEHGELVNSRQFGASVVYQS